MPRATHSPRARAGVSFELERLEVENDRLIVTGHWSGVRGMRFVRPTLVVGHRRVHASLEHKPWAPTTDAAWIAAFPWRDGDEVDATAIALAVAPSVTVPLVPAPAEEAAPTRDVAPTAPAQDVAQAGPAPPASRRPSTTGDASPRPEQPSAPAVPPAVVELDRWRADAEVAKLIEARDALRAQLASAHAAIAERDARCAELEELVQGERRASIDAASRRDELTRARATAERDRDRAIEQRDEAVKDREAAVRSLTRMEQQRHQAFAQRDEAASKLAGATRERDEARSRRDEAVVAYRALQRRLRADLAEADRSGVERHEAADTEPLAAVGRDPDGPLGVRTVPAARGMLGALQRPQAERKLPVSAFDLWALRILGTVAGACFISLLVMIMRVFV